MKLTVYFTNKQTKLRIGERMAELVKIAIKRTLAHEGFRKNAEVSVSFVDNESIHILNRNFRDKDRPTDVLSFPRWEDGDGFCDVYPATNAVMLGDIVISAERAKEQADTFGHSLAREICFLAVHSTLHLIGYDHEVSEADEKYMNDTQEAILASMGLRRN